MNTDDAFIAAMLEKSEDEALPLIYADWLEERGDPRSEYLRSIIALENLSQHDPEYRKICERLQALSSQIAPMWLSHVSQRFSRVLQSIWRFEAIAGAPVEEVGFSTNFGVEGQNMFREWFAEPALFQDSIRTEQPPENAEFIRRVLHRMRYSKD